MYSVLYIHSSYSKTWNKTKWIAEIIKIIKLIKEVRNMTKMNLIQTISSQLVSELI